MTREIAFTRSAELEFDSAIEWYETRSLGLGKRFAAEVRLLLRRISENPTLFAVAYRNVRRAKVRRFPFAVFFLEAPRQVAILTITHTSRDSEVWRKRIDDGIGD
ncbi:MAG: type II toxin-antitoxin system RelE/ParE family toxin [Pirellulales bacterium]